MSTTTTTFEIHGNRFFVHGEHLPLSPGLLEAARVWHRSETGQEFPLDRRVSVSSQFVDRVTLLQRRRDLETIGQSLFGQEAA